MAEQPAMDRLQEAIQEVIIEHTDSNILTVGEIIGVLEVIKMDIYSNMGEDDD